MIYNIIENSNKNLLDFNNKILIFEFNKYYSFLLKGYDTYTEIENQFIIDIERSNVSYNNFKIKDYKTFNYFLKKKYNSSLLKKIYIISSQTMFSYIYKLFVDVLPDNYILCELNNKNNKFKQIYLSYNYNNSLNISIYKCMRIFKFDEKENDKDIVYIIIYYNIDLENDNYIQCILKYYNNISNLEKDFKKMI